MSFMKSIKELREKNSLSQLEFAKSIDVKTGTIAEWESGESEPTLDQLTKICSVFHVSLDDLIYGSQSSVTELYESENIKEVFHNSSVEESEAKVDKSDELCNNGKRKIPKHLSILIVSIIVFISFVAGLCVFLFFRKTPFSDNTEAISNAENSVVKIYCYDIYGNDSASGSGFVYLDDKTIITNYHVMTEAYTCKISTNKEITYDVNSIIAYSKEKDVAVLELKESTGLTPLTLGDSDLINKGETVTAIGSPLGIKNVVSNGILSGRLAMENIEVLQFTAPISSGSSGGALFNESGEVIGITYASYVDGQNLNLAIPINEANNVYEKKTEKESANSICLIEHPYFSNKNTFDQAQQITLGQIMTNPEYYYNHGTNEYIFDATVSSVLDGQYIYIYTDNLVSKDFDYDNSIFETEDFENNHLIRIELDRINKENIDKNIVPGDMIRIIADRIIYNQRGQIDDFDGIKLTADLWRQIKNGQGQQYIATLNRVGCWPEVIYKLN